MKIDHSRRASRVAFLAALILAALLPAGLANAQKPTAAPKRVKTAARAASSTTSSSAKCVTLKLQGLDCPSCARQVQQSLMSVAGVQSADVSVPKQTAIVRLAAKNQPDNAALTAAVKKVGFGVTAVKGGQVK